MSREWWGILKLGVLGGAKITKLYLAWRDDAVTFVLGESPLGRVHACYNSCASWRHMCIISEMWDWVGVWG